MFVFTKVIKLNFDDMALIWDTERRVKRAKVISDIIKEKVKFHSDMNVLEFGCGTGLISYNLYQCVKTIIGYDSSDKMIEVYNMKAYELNINNVHSTNSLLEYSNQIDCVISSMVFHHILDIKSQLNEIMKVLKTNGEVFIIDLDLENGDFHQDELGFEGHNGFDRIDFKNILISVGCGIIDIGTVLHDTKKINGKDIPYSLFYVHARKV